MPKLPPWVHDPYTKLTPDGYPETPFRAEVRDILNLAWDARDETILNALRALVKDTSLLRVRAAALLDASRVVADEPYADPRVRFNPYK